MKTDFVFVEFRGADAPLLRFKNQKTFIHKKGKRGSGSLDRVRRNFYFPLILLYVENTLSLNCFPFRNIH